MTLKWFRQNRIKDVGGGTASEPSTGNNPDMLFVAFLQAATLSDAVQMLECLIACLRPVVTNVVHRAGFVAEDAEDVTGTILARLVETVWEAREVACRTDATGKHCDSTIRDVVGYTRTLAEHGAADTLRKRRPAWHRLKRRIVYLLDTAPPDKKLPVFARWCVATEWLGGLARWRGKNFYPTIAYTSFATDELRFWKRLPGGDDPATLPLPGLLTRLFHSLETPLVIDDLTRHVACLCRITDPSPLSRDHAYADGTPIEHPAPDCTEDTVVNALATEIVRAGLAREIALLPLRQRTVLLLAIPRDDLISLLDTAHDVAALLEIAPEEMLDLWNILPLGDQSIAARLNASPIQVSNLRKCARERLHRHKERWTK